MAPSFYHYLPVPMADFWREQGLGGRRLRCLPCALLLLLDVVFTVLLIYFILKANSEACASGQWAEQVCRNSTHQLQRQLTRAQEAVWAAEAGAATCNQTAVGLENALELERAQGRQQQARLEELLGEVAGLNQKLQEATLEVERLREQQAPSGGSDAASAGSSCSPGLGPWTAAALLLLGLGALRA
ncbi:bone marrow stromal antigen 2-like isoform X2 [Choloepus didactylus]|uniref:bone marrow stromal antigen 2-like isoform X2 n=1 Tax=Choloepus didactylus TaxID=27675 RepID=UPI0018A04040|nr:bone marrow stromal antigen 2-like isoform X2 [Choloepus didactylus]